MTDLVNKEANDYPHLEAALEDKILGIEQKANLTKSMKSRLKRYKYLLRKIYSNGKISDSAKKTCMELKDELKDNEEATDELLAIIN